MIGDDYTPPCGQSVPNANIDVVLVGDSHAAHLFPGLVELLPKKNIGYYTLGAIPPFDDGAEMKRIIDYIAQDPFIKTVIVNAYWSSYDVSERELLETLQKFRQNGKQVFVTDDIPFFLFPAYECKYPINPKWAKHRCTGPFSYFLDSYSTYYSSLENTINQAPGVQLLHTVKYFCEGAKCDMANDGTLMYLDQHHLNHQGSEYLVERLLTENPEFSRALSAQE